MITNQFSFLFLYNKYYKYYRKNQINFNLGTDISMFFAREFNPKRIKKCDTYKSRSIIIKNTNKNLRYLLEKRFFWMNKFIKKKKKYNRARIWKWIN